MVTEIQAHATNLLEAMYEAYQADTDQDAAIGSYLEKACLDPVQAGFEIVDFLAAEGYVRTHHTMRTPRGRITPAGIHAVQELHAKRKDPKVRAALLRAAMLGWLDEQEAADAQPSSFQGFVDSLTEDDEKFSHRELEACAEYLYRNELTAAVHIEEAADGWIRPRLTPTGRAYLTDHGGDVADYLRQQRGGSTHNSVHFAGDNKGNVAVGSENATQNYTNSPEAAEAPSIGEEPDRAQAATPRPPSAQHEEILVPPHPSEIKAPTPAGRKSIRHADLSLEELVRLFETAEAGRRHSEPDGITVNWSNGGETSTTAATLAKIGKPEEVAAVNTYVVYSDYSSLWLDVEFQGRSKPVLIHLRWHGAGLGRRRAEAIEGHLGALRDARKLPAFMAKPGITSTVSYLSALAALIVVARQIPHVSLPGTWDLIAKSAAGALIAWPIILLLPRAILNGRLIRVRPKHDWQAIGQMLSAVAALVAVVLSLVK